MGYLLIFSSPQKRIEVQFLVLVIKEKHENSLPRQLFLVQEAPEKQGMDFC